MAERITDEDAQYAFEIVKKICAEVGPGLPGSCQERERAAIIQRELEAHLGAENVTTEEFTFAPRAFLGSLPMSAVSMLIAALLNLSVGYFTAIFLWLVSGAALVCSVLAVLLVLCEFMLYYEFVDPIFGKKQSVNLIGSLRKPGTKNVRRLLILSGHHDSAPENTWLRYLGYGFFILTAIWLIGLVTMLAMSIIQLTGLLIGNTDIVHLGTLNWVMLLFLIVPSILFALFFTHGWEEGGNVPGAVDNLSACALAVAMCRFLVRNASYIPPDTEIRFISFGSEEAGLRGSRRYVERHLDELKHLDARVLNFEMVAYPTITILTSDVTGSVKNSPEMVKSVVAAAQRAGVPYKEGPATLGTATDAGPFSQADLKAVTLIPFKMPQQMVAFHHQRWDCPEVVTVQPLLNVLRLAFEWIRCGGDMVSA